jgi:uncharacterized protein DUF4262
LKTRDDDGFDACDKKVLDDIEKHGWHVVKVLAEAEFPAFAYSIGLYHSFGHPEVIVIGLNLDVAHCLINEVGEWARAGKRIKFDNPYGGLLEGFDCVFRPMNQRHNEQYLGYARWFYRSDDFPVVQCVWPDKQGHWPWEPSFNPSWRPMQPLLQD